MQKPCGGEKKVIFIIIEEGKVPVQARGCANTCATEMQSTSGHLCDLRAELEVLAHLESPHQKKLGF